MKQVLFHIVFFAVTVSGFAQDTLHIPMVIHVLASSEEQDVSDEQIQSQILSLNEDFNASNDDLTKVMADFQSNVSACRLMFFLTKIDLQGNPHDGIIRHSTTHGPFGNDDIYDSEKGGAEVWDPTKFLNVWVCDLTFGVDGLSSVPGSESYKDGVVIDFEAFGTIGTAQEPTNMGRTATHEIGHWLGLAHTWGTGGCASDDGIADTPPQGASSNCDISASSCGELEMAQNFMNSGADSCLLFFSLGQCDSMRSVLNSIRSGVIDNGVPAGTKGDELRSEIHLFPNPCGDFGINIQVGEGLFDVRLFDYLGILRFENLLHAENGSIFVPTNELPPGPYKIILRQGTKVHHKHFMLINRER